MKRLLASALLSSALLVPGLALAAPVTYEIDTSHSSAQFSVKHLMVSNVKGEFGKLTGQVVLDDADPSKSSVKAVVDATTINTRDEKRDGHLKSPDFFDVQKYPTLTFTSSGVEKAGAGKLKLTGDLTIHGVTKKVTFDVDGPTAEAKDPWGNLRRGATATTKINRKDFGLGWNQALETGGVLVGEEVLLTIDLEFMRQAATAPSVKPAAAKK